MVGCAIHGRGGKFTWCVCGSATRRGDDLGDGIEGNGAAIGDGGKTWETLTVPNGAGLDFRGVQSFGTATAYVMASGPGETSGIYKTTDAGKTWELQYSDKRKGFFLDALACADEKKCYALSDPVDGKSWCCARRMERSGTRCHGKECLRRYRTRARSQRAIPACWCTERRNCISGQVGRWRGYFIQETQEKRGARWRRRS